MAIYIELAGTAGMVALGRVLFAVGNASEALDGDLPALFLSGMVIFDAWSSPVVVTDAVGENGLMETAVIVPE